MSEQDRPSGEDEVRVFGPPDGQLIVTPTEPPVKLDEHGAIAEDIYCLTCGYNLRGLAGDPVRCPECGDLNAQGTAAIPASMIRKALRDMQTAPTFCAACALVMFLFGAIAIVRGSWAALCPCGLPALLWCVSCIWMKDVFGSRAGWVRTLVVFHAIALSSALVFTALGLSVRHVDRMRLSTENAVVLAGIWVIAVPAYILLTRHVYLRVRNRMHLMQRDAAIRIAREMLRRELHTRRSR